MSADCTACTIGKREVRVYDYADLNVPMLARMFDRRCRGYEAVGYTILLPASAVPGWPAEVPLPVDPRWKSDYAASVRRLVRDGVDRPLANLFVHVARDVPPDAEGVARARSATRGLPLPPAGNAAGNGRAASASTPSCRFPSTAGATWRSICSATSAGGRRARRRPAPGRRRGLSPRPPQGRLLQENGYFVLRFLAEDVGKQLDMVLDTILRALVHRQGR